MGYVALRMRSAAKGLRILVVKSTLLRLEVGENTISSVF